MNSLAAYSGVELTPSSTRLVVSSVYYSVVSSET